MPQTPMVLLLGSVPPSAEDTASHTLCALAVAPDGTLTVAGLRRVARVDTPAWTSLLQELRAGTATPVLVCCDGTPAVVRAVEATFPGVAIQYSIPHRLAVMRRSVDGRRHAGCTEEARRIFLAGDREAAAARFRAWRARWVAEGERAARDLETDLARCLAFYRLPRHLRARARSVCVVRHVLRGGARTGPTLRKPPPAADVAAGAGMLRAGPARVGLVPDAVRHLPDARALPGPSRPQRRRPRGWAVVGAVVLLAAAGASYLPGRSLRSLAVAQHRAVSPPTDGAGALDRGVAPAGADRDTIAVGGPATHAADPAAAGATAPPSIVMGRSGSPELPPQARSPTGPAHVGARPNGAPGEVAETPRSALPARGHATMGVSVILSATGRSWLRVTVDGIRVFEGVVRAGEIRQWTARRVIHIRTGNAGAADLTVNGLRLGVPGRIGQIASLTFTPSGARP